MKEQLLIVVNETARTSAKKSAVALHQNSPHSEVIPFTSNLAISPEVQGVVVVGGDGTVRAVTQQLVDREHNATMYVVPGGSQNGFYHALVDAHQTISADTLQDGMDVLLPKYHAGTMGSEVFNHAAGVGFSEVAQAEETERLRHVAIPRVLKAYLGAAKTAMRFFAESSPAAPMDLFMTSPFMGPYKVLPQQSLVSDKVARVSVRENNKVKAGMKLAVALAYGMLQQEPPASVATITYEPLHLVEKEKTQGAMNIDGEIQLFPELRKKDVIFVARSTYPVKAAALLL